MTTQSISFIAFTKDRPAQLDLMIRSLVDNFEGFHPAYLQVLMSPPSSKEMKIAYDQVQGRFPDVFFRGEVLRFPSPSGFRPGVKNILSQVKTDFLLFMMDDDVVTNKIHLGNSLQEFTRGACALTLRLGRDSNYSYTERRPFQWRSLTIPPVDHDVPEADRLMEWNWKSETSEPGYPCCLNFNIYPTEWFKWMEDHLDYQGPNSFEGAMSYGRDLFPSRMISFVEPKIIEIPVNKVQTENANEAGKTHPVDTAELARKYLEGLHISTSNLYGVHHNSPHIELPFTWEPRK